MKKLFRKWLKNLKRWYIEGLTGELQIDQRKLRKAFRKHQKCLEESLKLINK